MRLAAPGSISSTEHTRTGSDIARHLLELPGDDVTRRVSHAPHGDGVEHLFEESGDDEPFGYAGRHASTLEIEDVVLVDGPGSGRVAAAADVVLVDDLQVRHGVDVGAIAEHE